MAFLSACEQQTRLQYGCSGVRDSTHWIIATVRVASVGRSPLASASSSSRWVTTRGSWPYRYWLVLRSSAPVATISAP